MEILQKEKELLSIEYNDILSTIVEPKLKRAPNPEISERNPFKILAKVKELLQIEYVDDLFINFREKPENEIQTIDYIELTYKRV